MANAKPFRVTSPTDPGVRRDPSSGRLVSAEQVQPLADPDVIKMSGDKGIDVQRVIEQHRAPTGSTPLPREPMVAPRKPMKLTG